LALILMFWSSVSAFALTTSAESAILINADTKEIIYEQNAHKKLPMASTTKIMTSLILAEQPNLEKRIICTKEMVTVEGSSMGLLPGDSVSYFDLLYGMLLASGNDAANTTAIALSGSIENFVAAMNLKARAMGLKSTNFVTPSGLDDEQHYSTAYDMSILTANALKNENFKAASSSYTKTLFYGNPPYNRTLTNHNRLLKSYEGLIGVKTGFTKKSGRCLVTAAERDGGRIIVVTLNDRNDWQTHKNLLDYGFSSLQDLELSTDLDNTFLLVLKGTFDKVSLKSNPINIKMLPENIKRVEKKIWLPQNITAPVKSGDTVGKVRYYLDGNLIASSEIFADLNIDAIPKKSFNERLKEKIKGILLKI